MLAGILGTVLNWVGGGVLDKVLGHLQERANSETERLRIRTLREQHSMTTQASVITAGMAHKAFWVPWLIATVPLAAWFGWGMLDTLTNGALPDVALIPPGLEPWAQIAWGNLFYSGGGVAAATIVGQAIAKR
jgi:hypothetical protein